MFKVLISKDYCISIGICRYQRVLDHALSNVDISEGTCIYMLSSHLSSNKEKTVGFNSKTFISNTDIEIGSGKDKNKPVVYNEKFPVTPQKPGRADCAATKIVKSTNKPIKPLGSST